MNNAIRNDRQRKNVLKNWETQAVTWLCSRMPPGVTSNQLTAFGLAGSGVIFTALFLGRAQRWWLLGGILGLAIHWFGDSLDGRLAYYRRQPRKWFGFVLDLMADWISLCLISAGFAVYFPRYKFIPITFMAAYGAGMLIAATRYKITGRYRIDSGRFGPTEMRLLIAAILVVEIALPQSVMLCGGFALLGMVSSDVVEFRRLLRTANKRDRVEAGKRQLVNAVPQFCKHKNQNSSLANNARISSWRRGNSC
ncbi:MAG: hypothetical protein ALAOOOJD_03639 [bacterium]|nr:hypothetical protein [bacterium]